MLRTILFSAILALSLHGAAVESASAQRFGTDYNRGPLNVFDRENLFCGRGWKFPIIVWGERDVSVCIVKSSRRNVFGGDFGF